MLTTAVHPVAQLQGPFEESIHESTHEEEERSYPDPVARRNLLLERSTYSRVVAGRWKQKRGEKYHPLWKLVAQISFGIHLLAEGLAKSEDDVMQILQAHVDEIDGFLERTTEDFDLAQEDIQERLRCLKLPLSHPTTFDKMLEDRTFRLSIVDGNEKIEHIIDRTAQHMRDSVKDVQKGYDATTYLQNYLQSLQDTWVRDSLQHEAVYTAMLGNVEGWRKAFTTLHQQAIKLGESLRKLTDIINEMQTRAGEVSRRLIQSCGATDNNFTHHPLQHIVLGPPQARSPPMSRFASNKILPHMPTVPCVREASSQNGTQSSSSLHMRSQDIMNDRRQTLNPLDDTPIPRTLNSSNVPRVIELPDSFETRIRSIIPVLSGQSSPHNDLDLPDDEPERSFPPVELPASAPMEEILSNPQDRSSRPSAGLGITSEGVVNRKGLPQAPIVSGVTSTGQGGVIQSAPGSKPQPASMVDYMSKGRPLTSKPKVKTIEIKPSAKKSLTVLSDLSQQNTPVVPTMGFIKKNVRRPRKGLQHWFDDIDLDSSGDEKYSINDNQGCQTTTTTVLTLTNQSTNERDDMPETPLWAVTRFTKSEHKKTELKKNAFNSHPPNVPLGSPPVMPGNVSKSLHSARNTSHASSAGTIGEPGPSVAPSVVNISLLPTASVHRTASVYAPEVVLSPTDRNAPADVSHVAILAIPEVPNVLPATILSSSNESFKQTALELEAPEARRSFFQLPPRPINSPKRSRPQGGTTVENEHVMLEETLPLEDANPDPSTTKHQIQQQSTQSELRIDHTVRKSVDLSVIEHTQDQVEVPAETEPHLDIIQTTLDYLPCKAYVPTPQIPLPLSPLDDDEADGVFDAEEPVVLRAVSYQPTVSIRASTPMKVERVTWSENEFGQEFQLGTKETITNTLLEPKADTSAIAVERDQRQSDGGGATPTFIVPSTKSLVRNQKPTNLGHTRNSGSHGSNNGWRAFFQGQPSPSSSTLSIRSVRRPREPRSPVPKQSPTNSTKDVVWFNKTFSKDSHSPVEPKSALGDIESLVAGQNPVNQRSVLVENVLQERTPPSMMA